MILYHGSLEIVSCPRIILPSRTLDYGSGFYTTTSERQATEWAKRRLRGNDHKAYVNVYEVDESEFTHLKVLKFDKPSNEWIDFVESNRQNLNFTHDYDIVYGPVANDRVYAQLALYEQGFISKATLISEMKTYKLVDQMLFHTAKALACLKFRESIEVER